MKGRFLIILVSVILLLSGCSAQPAKEKEGLSVVASFYPVWVMAANVTEGVEGVELTLLTQEDTGCLHNYQLLPQDMKTLDGADILLLNGAGMEGFIEEAAASFAELTMVDTSDGLSLIISEEHDHTHGHEHEHDLSVNPHVWLNVDNAIAQTSSIADAIKVALPEQAEKIEKNAETYIARLETLKAEMTEILGPVKGAQLVTSHDAFAYFASAFDLEIAAVIQQDEETDPSAAHLGEICELMTENNIPAVFVQPDTTSSAPRTIAQEVGAQIVTIDPITGGKLDANSYENAQLANAKAIAEVLK